MDKDRINGSANQAKGAVKETVGKAVGDTKLQTEGTADSDWNWRRYKRASIRSRRVSGKSFR